MRIREAIQRVDEVKPNSYSDFEKVRWLAYIDGMLKNDTVKKHHVNAGEDANPSTAYCVDNQDVELLAPEPFSEMYVTYLKMKIDEENGETARYNNSAVMFNGQYADYVRFYHKEHRPNGVPFKWS